MTVIVIETINISFIIYSCWSKWTELQMQMQMQTNVSVWHFPLQASMRPDFNKHKTRPIARMSF